jgi:hypothetical protein
MSDAQQEERRPPKVPTPRRKSPKAGKATTPILSIEPSTRRHHHPWQGVSAAFTSMLIHFSLLMALALIVAGAEKLRQPSVLTLVNQATEDPVPAELVFTDEIDLVDAISLSVDSMLQIEAENIDKVSEVPAFETVSAAAVKVELSDFSDRTVPHSDLMRDVGALAGVALEGRGGQKRGEMVAKYGGSVGSERAVAMALKWFAKHQNKDGSWTMGFEDGPCNGECSQSGMLDRCSTGATALALLPFLGAGQTHEQGQYKEHVFKGLKFLLRVQDRRNGNLVSGGGSLYSHGLSTIVLCEAYAMTRADFLKQPAQAALNYICVVQDRRGGGWRYFHQQPGDTSAVGWQLMALKSGHMGNLEVPTETISRVTRFLNTVQSDKGSMYGYNSRRARPSTTAAGLLCRIYTGWERQHQGLTRGVGQLSELGPADSEEHAKFHMYYNYYATQVMRHYGGEPWEAWNAVLRDQLVKSQVQTDHMAGSWTIPNFIAAAHDAEMGGRLYYTSLATMILEVYYRYMPIYTESAAEEFPL